MGWDRTEQDGMGWDRAGRCLPAALRGNPRTQPTPPLAHSPHSGPQHPLVLLLSSSSSSTSRWRLRAPHLGSLYPRGVAVPVPGHSRLSTTPSASPGAGRPPSLRPPRLRGGFRRGRITEPNLGCFMNREAKPLQCLVKKKFRSSLGVNDVPRLEDVSEKIGEELVVCKSLDVCMT